MLRRLWQIETMMTVTPMTTFRYWAHILTARSWQKAPRAQRQRSCGYSERRRVCNYSAGVGRRCPVVRTVREWAGLVMVLYILREVRASVILRLGNLQVVNIFNDGEWRFRRN